MEIKTLVVGNYETNCYILSIDNNALVIDPGDDFELIKKELNNLNLLGILITHYHTDHIGALHELKEYFNAPVVDINNKEVIKPFNYEIIEFPGHKDDLVAFYFKDHKVMFVSDFIFKRTIGRCDLPGGNYNDMEESVKRLKTYPKDITLYPGHDEKTTLDEEIKYNPYF